MSRFFPHSEFAEDQSLAGTVLTTHVLYRGFQTGAVFGSVVGAMRQLGSRRPTASQTSVSQSNLASLGASSRIWGGPTPQTFVSRAIAGAGTGAALGTFLMVPGLVVRMWGRENIEWNDRSWRLLENQGQLEVDDWSSIGMVAGTVGSSVLHNARDVAPLKRAVGGASLGSLAGVLGYMAFRYGIHRESR